MNAHTGLASYVLMLGVVATPSAGLAQELHRQNPVNSSGGLSSQDARNSGGIGWFSEVADNFTAQDGWVVGSVEFWGGYVTDIPGNTHGFTVRFYADNGGQIGGLISAQDVMTFTETEYYQFTYPPPLGRVRGYHYTVELPTPVVLPGAGDYWMSVVAILDRGGGANEPQWGWVQAAGINPPGCRQWWFAPGQFTPQNQDVSFVLNAASSACDPDVNCDGVPDQDDVACMILAVAGDMSCFCQADADYNGDGVPDQGDVADVILTVAGAPCP